MGVSGALQWWREWQLRILVLGSLFIQFLLYFCATLRRLAIPSWFRSLIWLAYVGGDALAIYALATIFNRHKQQTTDAGGSALELIWAPVLLIHLGGQPNMTAYSLEDHLLWKQHAVIVVSKVTVALYVFIKWWAGEKRLLQAAVCLFIFGIVKFMEKPWALWSSSYDKVVASIAVSPRLIKEQDDLSLAKYVQEANKCVQQDAVVAIDQEAADNKCVQQDAVVAVDQEEAENKCVQVQQDAAPAVATSTDQEECFHLKMFADLPAPYSHRLIELRSFMKGEHNDAYNKLRQCHGDTFKLLYTKRRSISFRRITLNLSGILTLLALLLGLFLRTYLPFTVFASAVLFSTSHKDDYSDNDVRVTYVLLWCTTAMELMPFFPADFFNVTRWDGMVSQYNLMSFCCALRKKPTILMELPTFKSVHKYFYEHWYIGQEPAAAKITELVREHVKDGWDKYIHNTASYRVFNNCRGQLTMHNLVVLDCEQWQRQRLEQSLKVPFDKSVLLWHIATDLCFHHSNSSPLHSPSLRSREISNYMFYLLSIRPEMLMPGTRSRLSTIASDQIERILEVIKAPLDNEKMLAREIIDRMKPTTTSTETETGTDLIADACRLAEALMQLGDEKRWQLIQGVWVEMLCYSAARCRGYLHAKSLGEGGEYLSYVWLLWSFMGMETLAEKIHRPEPPGEEITAAAALASSSQSPV